MEPGKGIGGPANTFANIPEFPAADMRAVVRPNFDTLYSSGYLDMTKEPVVVSVPDTGGRFYLIPMLDMWSDVFASPGSRTTGTQAGNFLIVPPNWRPDLRDRLVEEFKLPKETQVIHAPTPHVWVIGRTKTDGPPDYAAVHKIQAGYKITPLSEWGKPAKPVEARIDPSIDMKTPPVQQVAALAPQAFFASFAELMKRNPPHASDYSIVWRMERLGIVQGQSFDLSKADPAVQRGLTRAAADAYQRIVTRRKALGIGRTGWGAIGSAIGVYGNDYLARAFIGFAGLGALPPEEAVYPMAVLGDDGKPLTGASNYVLHFEKDQIPPADAFWSLTMYGEDQFFVANPINRFAIGDRDKLKFNPDGSLDLYIQNASPGADKEANWLPAPTGPFTMNLRLYLPQRRATDGSWTPPPVKRVP